MEYNIVTNYRINQKVKQGSKYYTVKLGLATTKIDQAGERQLNTDDQFSYVYNTYYKASIQSQGSIGNINFYTDHMITDDVVFFYYEREQFTFDWDENFVKTKGVDAFLGSCIKKIETEYNEKIEQAKREKEGIPKEPEVVQPKAGDADKVGSSPGAVTYADLKAYLEKKNAERMKI
jgi:hypothetical protein